MHDTDLTTIENRLHALEKRITKTAAKSKTRMTLTIATMACLLVGAFFYLRFLSTSITTAADAPTLVQLVADQLEPRLQQAPAQLTESLKAQAPMVVDRGEQLVLDALPEALDQANAFIISFFEKEFEKSKRRLMKSFMMDSTMSSLRQRLKKLTSQKIVNSKKQSVKLHLTFD